MTACKRTQGLLDVRIKLVVALQRFPQVLLHICCRAWPAMACAAAATGAQRLTHGHKLQHSKVMSMPNSRRCAMTRCNIPPSKTPKKPTVLPFVGCCENCTWGNHKITIMLAQRHPQCMQHVGTACTLQTLRSYICTLACRKSSMLARFPRNVL
jgi:hypothetical protein